MREGGGTPNFGFTGLVELFLSLSSNTIAKLGAPGMNHWAGAEVLYGDTDSLFVRLPGRSVAEAFAVGAEIAAHVTRGSPRPVKLKLEKVYWPCLLMTN